MNLREEYRKWGEIVSPTNQPATFEEIGEWWLNKLSQIKSQIEGKKGEEKSEFEAGFNAGLDSALKAFEGIE